MTVFIAVAILICIAGVYTKIWDKRIEDVLPLSMFTLIGIVYVTGLAGSLKIGFWIVCLLGIISAVICFFFLCKERMAYIKQIVTPGCIAFLVLTVLIWVMSRGRYYMQWDDFSHWGLVVKNMHIFQQFGNIPESTVKFVDYPPGASIFAFFFTNFGNYNESNAICGMSILTIGMMIPLFRMIKWEDKKSLVLSPILLFLIYVLPTSFHKNTYIGLYVDTLLGILLFYLFFVMLSYEKGAFRIISITAGCAMLALTKASGTGLAAMALCFGIAVLFLTEGKEEKKYRAAELICGAAGILLAQQSWKIYLKMSGSLNGWSASEISLGGILDLFTGNAPEYRIQTLKNYLLFLITEPMGGWFLPFSTLIWLILFIVFACIFIKRAKKEEQKKYKGIFIGLIAGFVVYLVFMLVLYLFSYSEFEAVRLASADRYISTYILGMLCIYVGMFVSYEKEKRMLVMIAALVFTMFSVTKEGIEDVLLYPKESMLTSQLLEEGYRGAGRFQNKLNYKEDRVYVISQNNYGMDYWVLRNVFTPVKINDNYTWSIGESYGPGDVFTANKDMESWSQDLKHFDYVYLFRVDEQFIRQFGPLFENTEDIKNDTMFTINWNGELAHLVKNEEMTAY